MRAALLLALGAIAAQAQVHKIGRSAQRAKKFDRKQDHLLGSSCSSVESHYFSDAVRDNFADVDAQEAWQSPQRYWINRELWAGPGAPVFVYIGGEGSEGCGRLAAGATYMYDLAQTHQALLVDVEHRFYGASQPTGDLTTESLELLTSEQALADLARVITHVLDVEGSASSPVVVVGGSYPGALSAWFRAKYPHVATAGSIASSAPVNAVEDFHQYMEVVGRSLTYFGGEACYSAFAAAADALAGLLAKGQLGQVTSDFSLCDELSGDKKDVATFLSDVMGNVQGTVQYNNEIRGVMNVTDICDVMLDGSDAYVQFVKLSGMYLSENGETCLDASYEAFVEYLSETDAYSGNAYRPWIWQCCNDFGYWQTATGDSPFESWGPWLDLAYYRDSCSDIYGLSHNAGTAFTNMYYGGLRVAGSNTIFSDGNIDPWHSLSINSTTDVANPSIKSVFIQDTAHCKDLSAPKADDPADLTAARETIADIVASWLP